jgi:hypothetical protein
MEDYIAIDREALLSHTIKCCIHESATIIICKYLWQAEIGSSRYLSQGRESDRIEKYRLIHAAYGTSCTQPFLN